MGLMILTTTPNRSALPTASPALQITSITARQFSQSQQENDVDLTPFDALRGTQTFTSTIWS